MWTWIFSKQNAFLTIPHCPDYFSLFSVTRKFNRLHFEHFSWNLLILEFSPWCPLWYQKLSLDIFLSNIVWLFVNKRRKLLNLRSSFFNEKLESHWDHPNQLQKGRNRWDPSYDPILALGDLCLLSEILTAEIYNTRMHSQEQFKCCIRRFFRMKLIAKNVARQVSRSLVYDATRPNLKIGADTKVWHVDWHLRQNSVRIEVLAKYLRSSFKASPASRERITLSRPLITVHKLSVVSLPAKVARNILASLFSTPLLMLER